MGRRGKSAKDPGEPERRRDPLRDAVEMLRSLPQPPMIDARTAKDPLALAQIIFEHGDQLDYTVFFRAIHRLIIDEVVARTKARLLQDYYFLDPLYVADTVIGRLFAEWCIHLRAHPLAEWIPDVIDRAARDCLRDPEAQLHYARREASSRDKMAYDIERFLNLQDRRSRQLAWKLFLEKKSMHRIALETAIPFEHVEAFFVELGTRSIHFSKTGEIPGADDATDRGEASEDGDDSEGRSFEEGSDG